VLPDLRPLIDALVENHVDFVIIGGVALVLHGSARTTQDLDVCYARTGRNFAALATALQGFHPRLRGAPPGLPFRLDAPTLKAGLNFTLSTDADLLGEVTGVGSYVEVMGDATEMEVYDRRIRIMSLDTLDRAVSRMR
jgi:hypothetical protein